MAQKSNEITAIPRLLDMLSVDGAIITIDAMRCQRESARKIIDKDADYLLALKGNQGTLRKEVEIFTNEQKARKFYDCRHSQHRDLDYDRGRRNTTMFHDVDWLQQMHDWPGLKAIVIIKSEREISGRIEHETRFYITSSTDTAEKIGAVVRGHWAVESMHRIMNCVVRDVEYQVGTKLSSPASYRKIELTRLPWIGMPDRRARTAASPIAAFHAKTRRSPRVLGFAPG